MRPPPLPRREVGAQVTAAGRPPSAGVTAAHSPSALAEERHCPRNRLRRAEGRYRLRERLYRAVRHHRPRDRLRRAVALPLRRIGVRARRRPAVAPSFLGVQPWRRTCHPRGHCPWQHPLALPLGSPLELLSEVPSRVPARQPTAPCLRGEEAVPRPAAAAQARKMAARLRSWAARCRSRAPSLQGREQGYQTSANSPPHIRPPSAH